MSNRLEEIKEHIAWTVDNGLVPRLDDSDLDWLINRVEELESNLLKLKQWEFETKPYVKSLEIQNQRYKQALEFYADEDNYCVSLKDNFEPILQDNGKIAQEALEQENDK